MVTVLLFLFGVLVSTSTFVDSLSIARKNNCTLKDFTCRNGKCTPHSSRCNGNSECGDGSDEEACDLILCEEPIYFRCKNKRCISKLFVCDGEDDCADFSDEEDCSGEMSKPVRCVSGQWQCSDEQSCIPEDWVCNGFEDCPDHSDELEGCTSKINCAGFKCNDGNCIPNEWVCNGYDDCNDKSDEQNCVGHSESECDGFICKNGQCIPNEWVCNGQQECTDQTDELNCIDTPKETDTNHENGKEPNQKTLLKLISILKNSGDVELQQAQELLTVKMQDEEDPKPVKIRVKVAKIQFEIKETKLETVE